MSAGMREPRSVQRGRAPSRCLCLSLLLPAFAGAQVLGVPAVVQEQSEWCWAAVSSSILGYYKKPRSQCAIAEYARTKATWHDYGQVDCCKNPSGACNYWDYNWGYPGSIQDILQTNGIQNAGVPGVLTHAQVRTEVAARRPFVIRWAWTSGGGHFIVGTGLVDSTLYYMNPWPGEGAKIADYSWVVSSSAHAWEGTNTLKTSPVVGATRSDDSDPLRVRGQMTTDGLEVSWSSGLDEAIELRAHSLDGRLVGKVCLQPQDARRGTALVSGWSFPPGGAVLSLRAGEVTARAMVIVDR